MYKFEFSLLYTHIDFNQTETNLLFLSSCLNGVLLINCLFLHIFPWINGSQLKYEKLLFSFLKTMSLCPSDGPAPACVELTSVCLLL